MESETERTGHLVFVWSPRGYELEERVGLPPDAGSEVSEDGRRFRVTKVGPSPLPGDRRTCVYLQPA